MLSLFSGECLVKRFLSIIYRLTGLILIEIVTLLFFIHGNLHRIQFTGRAANAHTQRLKCLYKSI